MAKKNPPIDWDALLDKQTVHQAAENAADQTDAQLAPQIAALTNLTQKDIQDTFPKKSDQEKLVKLMQIVNSSKSRNDKINTIVDNSKEFAGIILSLLGKFL